MFKQISISAYVVLIFSFAFIGIFGNEINKDRKQQSCLAAYDQFGYYSYLPATFIYKDLHFQKSWKDSLLVNYCPGTPVYQYADVGEGKKINIYHMGMAYMQLPGFLIADSIAPALGYKRDGMSFPYRLFVRLTALTFLLMGLFYLRKTLLLFFQDKIVALVLCVLYVGSNMYVNFFYGELMPHLYLFTLNVLFVYTFVRYFRERIFRHLLVSALILGLTTAIRPTQAIWGVIPFILLFFENKIYWRSIRTLLIFPLFILVFNIPQLLYWKFIGGNWFILNLHTESLALTSPYTLDFLFSYKKGWLLYSPIFILALIGFAPGLKKDKNLTRAFLIFTLLNIYVISSWDCWWYAASYGSRVMIDSYVIMAICLGFLIEKMLLSKWKIILIGFLFCIFITLNIFQSIQFFKGTIELERMTKDHYWYVFARLNIPDYDDSLLEIDRSDLNWEQKILNKNSNAQKKGYKILSKKLGFLADARSFGHTEEFVDLLEFFPKKNLPTDEAKITVSFYSETSVCQGPSYLTVAIEGKKAYYFNYIILDSLNKRNVHEFNLPHIRQKGDKMKLYIYNPNKCAGKISKLTVKARYLNRNN